MQGTYAEDPLTAGLMMAPFGAAFLVVGLFSGFLSVRFGSCVLVLVGLFFSVLGLLGLSTGVSTTPFWLIAAYMVLMGGGSGLFNSPNVNAMMSSVSPRQRGSAAGVNTMLANTGQMLSISIAFPLVLSRIPEDVMFKVFLYGGGMGDAPDALHAFESGLHQAILVSFAITIVAALVSAFRPSHSPAADHAATAAA